MKKLAHKILTYFTYPSTWSGLVKIMAAGGIVLKPEYAAATTSIGLAVSGAINTIWSDADVKAAK